MSSPQGGVYPLDLGDIVSPAFPAVGPRAEWRLAAGRPVALIVRFNANETPDHSERTVSRLVVSRSGACVVAVVQPVADMHAQARRLADRAAQMPCLAR